MTNIFDKDGNILPNIDVDSITEIEIPDWMTEVPDLDVFKNLTSVTIPDSITEIKDFAFAWCKSLSHISLPKNLISIGKDAFSGCYSLTEIEIPDSVTEIKDSAFYGCTNLSNIKLSNNLISIGENAFDDCKSLAEIEIPDSVTEIKDNAFDGCTSLSHIKLSNNLSSIGYEAFRGCDALTELEIPENVQHIEEGAFSGCANLQSVTILGETKVDENAFDYCLNTLTIPLKNNISPRAFGGSRPQELYVTGCVENSKVVENLYQALNKNDIRFFAPWNGKTHFCGQTFTSEHGWMFDEKEQITLMLLTDHDGEYGDWDLVEEQLRMPNLPELYYGIFKDASGVISLYKDDTLILPPSLKIIKQRIFDEEYIQLPHIKMPSVLKVIESFAFYHTGLKDITIPPSAWLIDNGALCTCEHTLESIRFEGKVNNINSESISETGELPEGLKTIIVPKGLKEYYTEKLSGCKGVKEIIVEE